MTDPDPATARGLLDQARVETLRRIDAMTARVADIVEGAVWESGDDEHDPEGATIAFERAQAQSLLAAAREDLVSLDRAYARLEAGTYGSCSLCGRTLSAGRLEALPTADRCVRCADRGRR
ncbi:DNA-binding protein [Amycolatopsis antarctica]|uniref:DNA-binding protein n=2 Tax=Amycolatopsis antarctica TaxID=1854586 RepID=A0A263D451_9PSEU|nr:DNA-binding protein [Amycolatopsis antarctica]